MGTKYSSVSVSGFNSSPPSDDGSTASTNQVYWSTIKTKLADPLNSFASSVNSALVTALDQSVRLVSSSDSTTAADHDKTIQIGSTVTSAVTISLLDAATAAAGYIVTVSNQSAIAQTVGRLTASNTINGATSDYTLPAYHSVKFLVASPAVGYLIAGQSANTAPATLTGTETLTNKTLVAPALGTPASGVVTNLTGTASININGTVGATTPASVSATTGAFSGDFAVATNKFTVAAASGNTVVAGTLGVTGALNTTAAAGVGGVYNVAGWRGLSYDGNILKIGNAYAAGQWDEVATYIYGSKVISATPAGLAVAGNQEVSGVSAVGTTANGSYVLRLNATTPLLGMMVSGTQAFSIGANSGGGATFYVGSGNTTAMTLDSSGNLLAGTDNAQTLGNGSYRWSVVYAGTGTINTSDAREKTLVRGLSASEINASKQLAKEVGAYQWLSAVSKKGNAARLHIGLTVQRAIEIMESNGLDPMAYGFICYDSWADEFREHPAIEAADATYDDEGNELTPAVEAKAAWTEQTQAAGDRFSFRMDELSLFIARGIDARISALEAA